MPPGGRYAAISRMEIKLYNKIRQFSLFIFFLSKKQYCYPRIRSGEVPEGVLKVD